MTRFVVTLLLVAAALNGLALGVAILLGVLR